MMRVLLAAAVCVAAMALDACPAQAREAPWCAVVSLGSGSTYWDCQYRSVEECRPNVIAGNRGFCNHNPRYEGEAAPAKARHAHRKRHFG
jgi:hypothetical protein